MRLLLVLLAGCSVVSSAGGVITEYTACPIGAIDCGHVYECEAPSDNDLGHVEICIDDDDHPADLDAAEDLYGQCVPTPRHQGLCKWCIGPDCGRGCNAFNGCFSPLTRP